MECGVSATYPSTNGGAPNGIMTDVRSERSPAKSGLHVNFSEKGEVKERREKFLTAKYGSHQMSLIRKRLAVEMWLYDELQKLYEPSVSARLLCYLCTDFFVCYCELCDCLYVTLLPAGMWRLCIMLSITGLMNLTISWCSKWKKNAVFSTDLKWGCTNPGSQDTLVTGLFILVPDVCGSSVSGFLCVTHLTPRVLRWLLDFWKICASLT